MTALVLITGSLQRPAEQKTSASGKPYTIATLRVKAGDASQFWSVMAFDEQLQITLQEMRAGDGVSVSGRLNADIYKAKEGEPRVALSVIADQALPLRRKPMFNLDQNPKPIPGEPARYNS
jgi:single-stranded DNA-binding protein